MAAETVSNLVFTGPLTWTSEASCHGQSRVVVAPPGGPPPAPAGPAGPPPPRGPRGDVLHLCREWARDHREYGFWGGESEEERAAAGFRVDMPVGRVARYPRGDGQPVAPRDARDARIA